MQEERAAPPSWVAGTVVLAFLLAAAAVLTYDVVREIPADHSCWETSPSGFEAARLDYRSGSIPLHLATIVCALLALALLSARKAGRGPAGVGLPTLVATAAVAVAASLALAVDSWASDYVLVALFLISLGFVLLADPLGPQVTGALAVLLLAAVAAWARRALAAGRTTAVTAALWALVVLAGAHLLLVRLQGDWPALC